MWFSLFFCHFVSVLSAQAENFSQGGVTIESFFGKKTIPMQIERKAMPIIHNGSFNKDRLISISSDFGEHIVIHQAVNE